jgi:hypothetical protein
MRRRGKSLNAFQEVKETGETTVAILRLFPRHPKDGSDLSGLTVVKVSKGTANPLLVGEILVRKLSI